MNIFSGHGFRGISICLRVFSKVNVQNGDIFGGCTNFKYFLRVYDFPDFFFFFFFWQTGDVGSKPSYEE